VKEEKQYQKNLFLYFLAGSGWRKIFERAKDLWVK
jgi:hypothetical protein